MAKIPEIILKKGKKVLLEPWFYNSVGGEPIIEMTIVELLYDGENLIVKFECLDDRFVDLNSFKEDNTELWHQEVFEVFIAMGSEPPAEYLEIEINPNNAVFIAKITNPDLKGSGLKAELIPPEKSGILHNVTKGASMWKGFLKIPLAITNFLDEKPGSVYRVNFYRTILKEDQGDIAWQSTKDNTVYACWSSTMADEPAFHRSEYFGKIVIKD